MSWSTPSWRGLGKGGELRDQVEILVVARQSKTYAEAIQVLQDMREVATRRGTGPDFARRLAALRDRHAKKRTFLESETGFRVKLGPNGSD